MIYGLGFVDRRAREPSRSRKGGQCFPKRQEGLLEQQKRGIIQMMGGLRQSGTPKIDTLIVGTLNPKP